MSEKFYTQARALIDGLDDLIVTRANLNPPELDAWTKVIVKYVNILNVFLDQPNGRVMSIRSKSNILHRITQSRSMMRNYSLNTATIDMIVYKGCGRWIGNLENP